MSNTTIHRANTVSLDKFEFGDPTVNKYGGKSCKVKYEGSDFYLQLPRMRLPYGMSVYEEKDVNGMVTKSKYSLDFSLSGYEINDKGEPGNQRIYELFNFLQEFQGLLHKTASENSSEWLGVDDATIEVAKALCRDEIRYSKDKLTKKPSNKYPPTFKSKLGFWDGRFMCNAFDEHKQPIEDLLTACPGGSEAVAIIKLQQVTFAGGKCGYSWNVHQLKVYPPTRMPSYAFLEDDEDNQPLKAPVIDEEKEASSTKPEYSGELVNDSDEDEEDDELDQDEDDEEEEEPPAPPPKKKVIKRKPKKNES